LSAVGRISRRILDRFGLAMTEQNRKALQGALEETSRVRGMNLDAVAALACGNDGVLQDLAGRITIGESFFYRHPEQLGILMDELKKKLTSRSMIDPVVIWSAGCADGQEPYSIAVACLEHLTEAERSLVRIIGTDLNSEAIARARQGVYNEWSFRGFSPVLRARYFKPKPDGSYALRRDILESVEFSCLSVQDQALRFAPHSVDFLFFRNVVIYLYADAQEEAYRCFYDALGQDAFLFAAPSDPVPPRRLFRWSGHKSSAVFYRIPEETKPTKAPPPAVAKPAVAHTDVLSCGSSLRGETREKRPAEAPRTTESLETDAANQHKALLIRALGHLEQDRAESAAESFRRAVFLCPNDPITKFWYAVSLHRSGVPNRSLAQIHHVVSLLSEMPTDMLLSDGQTTAGELMSAAMQLEERLI